MCSPKCDTALDDKPRCLGIISGHTVNTMLGVFTGILIPYGDISAKETNVGAFGLQIGFTPACTFTYVGLVMAYLKTGSDPNDESGGSGLLSAYTQDGTYTLTGCVIGGKHTPGASKRLGNYRTGIIFGLAWNMTRSSIMCFGVVNPTYSCSFN